MVANNDEAVEISEREFDETISNSKKKLVVVDFFAEWCMPCVMMEPIIEDMASKIKSVKFAKVNVDDNQTLANKFNVSSIPTLVIFKGGEEIDRINGSLPAEVLEERIKKNF